MYSFPIVSPSILCVFSVDVQVSIILFSLSNTVSFAPTNSLSPVISVLEKSTNVVSFDMSNFVSYTFVVKSFCSNLTSYFVLFNTSPSKVFVSSIS